MKDRFFPSLFPQSGGVLLLIILLSCGATPVGNPMTAPIPEGWPQISLSLLEKEIHHQVNLERLHHGLPPLAWDDRLARIAERHSRNMVEKNFFAHRCPKGYSFANRYEEEGYTCAHQIGRTVYCGGENLLQTYLYDFILVGDGQQIYNWLTEKKIAKHSVDIWMKSSAHRTNILSPYFQREGLGIAISPDGKVYVTQDFC
jgi:uncharacterized protein YkwD